MLLVGTFSAPTNSLGTYGVVKIESTYLLQMYFELTKGEFYIFGGVEGTRLAKFGRGVKRKYVSNLFLKRIALNDNYQRTVNIIE